MIILPPVSVEIAKGPGAPRPARFAKLRKWLANFARNVAAHCDRATITLVVYADGVPASLGRVRPHHIDDLQLVANAAGAEFCVRLLEATQSRMTAEARAAETAEGVSHAQR